MEEHTNAVAAMSNWAARIAGGRILKERFQQWLACTYKTLWHKSARRAALKNLLMRFAKSKVFIGFRTWKNALTPLKMVESHKKSVVKYAELQKAHSLKLKNFLLESKSTSIMRIAMRFSKLTRFLGFNRWKSFSNRIKINRHTGN